MKSNILRRLNGILLFLTGIPLALADNRTNDEIVNSVLRPNLVKGILGIPVEIQNWITWTISVAFLGATAYIIIRIFHETVMANIDKKRGNSKERSMHIENILSWAIKLVIMIVSVLLIIFLATRI